MSETIVTVGGGQSTGLELTEAAEGDRAACNAVIDIGVGGSETSARGCYVAPSEDGGLEEHAMSRLGGETIQAAYMSGYGRLGTFIVVHFIGERER